MPCKAFGQFQNRLRMYQKDNLGAAGLFKKALRAEKRRFAPALLGPKGSPFRPKIRKKNQKKWKHQEKYENMSESRFTFPDCFVFLSYLAQQGDPLNPIHYFRIIPEPFQKPWGPRPSSFVFCLSSFLFTYLIFPFLLDLPAASLKFAQHMEKRIIENDKRKRKIIPARPQPKRPQGRPF